METTIGGEANHFYDVGMPRLHNINKQSLEWDLNDWKWDGDLFTATRLDNSVSNDLQGRNFTVPLSERVDSSNTSSSCSHHMHRHDIERVRRDSEKRRRVIENRNEEQHDLSLNIGGHEKEGTKRNKYVSACQVEDCLADLSGGKDYHRRHKVCEMHSKASKALVRNILQRFCQQCSRFHALQEFDEGKRSCRRRLAGHNKRRRKTNRNDVVNRNSSNDDQASSYLLISILRILANMQSTSRSEQAKDQDMLSHLLTSLAGNSNHLPTAGTLFGNSGMISNLLTNVHHGSPVTNSPQVTPPKIPLKQAHADGVKARDGQTVLSSKLNNFDLNSIYVDSNEYGENIERNTEGVLWRQRDSNECSPPQTSRNSDSASDQSPSSSGQEAQGRTDRIVFKLFGKGPNDIPSILRAQVFDWLSHSPTDIESYIRPGCIILTIYLRLSNSAWNKLSCDLSSSLRRLVEASDNSFWRTGWLYIRVQHQIAFICDGHIVVDTPLPLGITNYTKILSVRPIAITVSENAQFLVKGLNLSWPTTRLLCALDGQYIVQKSVHELIRIGDILTSDNELQCLNFSCSIPMVSGRGFIEIEDHGLGSSFFPFLVAEQDVCSEIRMLESAIECNETNENIPNPAEKIEAINFIHEMGWLLHRSHLKSRLGRFDPNSETFPLKRFKWVLEFSMEHDWCNVVKKLLDVFFEGTVALGEYGSFNIALLEMSLLHRAVRRNFRPLVELLLRYVPKRASKDLIYGNEGPGDVLFRPDDIGPAGLTPLHIAAGRDGSEDVLDALTDDPKMVGIEAWKNARDTADFTPKDYACLRGHYSYVHLVQRKISKGTDVTGQVSLEIPEIGGGPSFELKRNDETAARLEIECSGMKVSNCRQCIEGRKGRRSGRSMSYRPAMLSMVATAAICVCVALLFKTTPYVNPSKRTFRWEWLQYGPR